MVVPSVERRAVGSRRGGALFALAAGLVALGVVILGLGLSDVILTFQAKTNVASAGSPFLFANGGNYAAAHAQGLVTDQFANVAHVSVTANISGVSGAYGTYLLDTLEIVANATTAVTWHLRLDVTTALAGKGINAAYLSYCTASPTTVPDTGVPLASGTDANGNPWAIFAPTCAGTSASLPLTAVGAGTSMAIAGLTTGTSVLFVSFLLAVTNTAVSTTTSATIVLSATTP
ncbi:MAG TPA: hypothetical protein VFF67_06895 [Thermoplasmata archaeon]|nr:hypothetical protein [Thermoplasmata archaeon]